MRPNEHVRATVTPDGLVLLDIDRGKIYTANPVAARIWQGLFVDKWKPAEVAESIAREFDTKTEQVGEDMRYFLAVLEESGLVRGVDAVTEAS